MLKSNKTLFLLTKTYPYDYGEQYITNELQQLSEKFEKVIIYPNDYYGNKTDHNKLIPKNVEILNFNQTIPPNSSNSLSDYLYLLKNAFSELIKTDDRNYFFKNFKWNLINFWTQFQISKQFTAYLKENNFNSSNAVFYSYWFHKSAILLSILIDKKVIEKFVSRAHSIDLYHQDWGIINDTIKVPSFKMFKLKNTSAIFPVSEHGTNYLKNKFPQYSSKIITHYLGVANINEQTPMVYNGAFHIVTCSGIDYNKRIHKLAEALINIKHQVLWTHFGSGALLQKVEEISKQFPENIQFHFKGNTPNQEIQSFYVENKVNLFVNLSIVEGLPVSIMEVMPHGIPVLATEVYGTPEAVIENKNGFLLNVDFTINDLVNKLNYCIEHQDQLKQMGKASKEIYLEKFNAKKNYSHFANYLASL